MQLKNNSLEYSYVQLIKLIKMVSSLILLEEKMSCIYIYIYIYIEFFVHSMIALQKWWIMLFISS